MFNIFFWQIPKISYSFSNVLSVIWILWGFNLINSNDNLKIHIFFISPLSVSLQLEYGMLNIKVQNVKPNRKFFWGKDFSDVISIYNLKKHSIKSNYFNRLIKENDFYRYWRIPLELQCCIYFKTSHFILKCKLRSLTILR